MATRDNDKHRNGGVGFVIWKNDGNCQFRYMILLFQVSYSISPFSLMLSVFLLAAPSYPVLSSFAHTHALSLSLPLLSTPLFSFSYLLHEHNQVST